jgi:hypothetical protein
MRECGWVVTDPMAVTRTPVTYQEFIRDSKAEFSVAKHGYVASRSGWFSERSAAYLASGRPVVTQNTGFPEWLDRDAGVLAYDSPASAIDAIERVSRDYLRHAHAALEVAREYFDSSTVLRDLLARAA